MQPSSCLTRCLLPKRHDRATHTYLKEACSSLLTIRLYESVLVSELTAMRRFAHWDLQVCNHLDAFHATAEEVVFAQAPIRTKRVSTMQGVVRLKLLCKQCTNITLRLYG